MIKRVLAWDDEPEKDFDSLKQHLERYKGCSISVRVETAIEEFWERFRKEDWDFIITDILHENWPVVGEEAPLGREIAQRASQTHPVFVYTRLQETQRITELDLPQDVVVKTKFAPPSFVAQEIIRDLRQRGLLPKSDRVFLIGGASEKARTASRELQTFLVSQCQLDGVVAAREELEEGDLDHLQKKMRNCAAIVAVCSPDELGADNKRYPDAQTLMQLGVAAGLPNGLRRLVLIQQWGGGSEDRAVLPKSLRRIPPLQFKSSMEEVHDLLAKRLEDLQVEIHRPPT